MSDTHTLGCMAHAVENVLESVASEGRTSAEVDTMAAYWLTEGYVSCICD